MDNDKIIILLDFRLDNYRKVFDTITRMLKDSVCRNRHEKTQLLLI